MCCKLSELTSPDSNVCNHGSRGIELIEGMFPDQVHLCGHSIDANRLHEANANIKYHVVLSQIGSTGKPVANPLQLVARSTDVKVELVVSTDATAQRRPERCATVDAS